MHLTSKSSGRIYWLILSSCFVFASCPLVGQTCNFYVGPNGSNSTGSNAGQSEATAFQTLQYAHDYIASASNATVTQLRVNPITVCALTGNYTALDYASASNTSNVSYLDVLDISVYGTASAPITFTAAPGNTPAIIQTGWSGVEFKPTAAYVTFSGFSVSGMVYNADWTVASSRYANTNPIPYAYYDGNCITVAGDAVDSTAQIPNHIVISNNYIYACGGGGIAAQQSDYLTIDHNNVHDCSWTSIYGTSGISTLDNVNSDSDTRTTTPYKIFITNNYVYGNNEQVPWVSGGPAITDGEGIIVDTNDNSVPITNSVGDSVTLPAYQGRTLVANNVIWNNGSAGVEAFKSLHVDVENNSTYKNVTTSTLAGRGELFLNQVSDVTAANNVLYGTVPVSGSVLPGVSGAYAWFENNVYFAGAGVSIEHPTSYDAGFSEGVNEVFGYDPLYMTPVPSPSYATADLRVGSLSASDAAENGCSCYTPAVDILGDARPGTDGYYASGAYANPH